MKTHMILLLTLSITIIGDSAKEKNYGKKNVHINVPLNNINWKQYGLHGEIAGNKLRVVRENITITKSSSIKSCPLGDGKRDYKSIDNVLPRLIQAVKKTSKTMDDQENAKNSVSNHDAIDDKSGNKLEKINKRVINKHTKLAFGPPSRTSKKKGFLSM